MKTLRKKIGALILLFLLVGSFTFPTSKVEAKENPGSTTSLVGKVDVNADWNSFWSAFKRIAVWDLEYFDGSKWISRKDLLDVILDYPESNICKITLDFKSDLSGNYRLTFAINKKVKSYVTKLSNYQYVLNYSDCSVMFDWNDMKDISGLRVSHGVLDNYFWFRIRRDNVPANYRVIIDPSLVGVTVDVEAIFNTAQRKSWYSAGRYWVGYSDGSGASEDWPAMLIKSTPFLYTDWYLEPTTDGWHRNIMDGNGYNFGIFFDGTYVHIAKSWDSGHASVEGPTLSYRRGIPLTNGSITWSDDWQTIEVGDALRFNRFPNIAVDSDGYPLIITTRRTNGNWGAYYWKSDYNNGSWTTGDNGFLKNIGFPNSAMGTPIPLESNKMLLIYSGSVTYAIYYRIYDGSLGAEQILIADGRGSYWDVAGVGIGSEAYITYLYGSQIMLQKYNGTDFEPQIYVISEVSSSTLTKFDNKLMIFWEDGGDDAVYRKEYNLTSESLGSRETVVTGTDLYNRDLNAFYESDVVPLLGEIYGVTYVDHTSINVMFASPPTIAYFNITNREIGADIIKTDYIFYNVETAFKLVNDTIGWRFYAGTKNYTGYYDISAGTLSYNRDNEWRLENPSLTDDGLGNYTLTFKMWLSSYITDEANLDIWMFGNNTDGSSSGWILIEDDYVDLLSYGGLTKYEISGTAGRIYGGDWQNLYADNGSSAYVEFIYPDILSVMAEYGLNPCYGWTDGQENTGDMDKDGRYYFGMDYSINGTGWIPGWHARLTLNHSVLDSTPTTGKNYFIWKVDWFRGNTLEKTEYVASYWQGHDNADDKTTLAIRFWFNQENGSSVGGAWISPKEYGVTETGWFGFKWKPKKDYNDVPCYEAYYFFELLNNYTGTGITLRDIDTTRYWIKVERNNTEPGKQYRIEYVESFEHLVGGRQDSHSSRGIPTPAPSEPVMLKTGFWGGMFKWISSAVYAVARQAQNLFTSVLNEVFSWITRQDNVITSVFRWIYTGWIYVAQVAGEMFDFSTTILGTVFTRVFGFMLAIFTYITGAVTFVTGWFINMWDPILEIPKICNAWLYGLNYVGLWETYDFSSLYNGGQWNMFMKVFQLLVVTMGPVISIMDLANGGPGNPAYALTMYSFKFIKLMIWIWMGIAKMFGFTLNIIRAILGR